MRLETLAELAIEAVEENESDLLLAERIRELVSEHKSDLAEMENISESLGCDGGACFL